MPYLTHISGVIAMRGKNTGKFLAACKVQSPQNRFSC
jgi:hypothetical protein